MMVAKRLGEIMKERRVSQAELCRRTGILPSVMSEICTGKRGQVSTATLEKLAAGLGVSPAELVTEPEKEPVVCRLLEREIGEAAMWELLEWVRKIKRPPG